MLVKNENTQKPLSLLTQGGGVQEKIVKSKSVENDIWSDIKKAKAEGCEIKVEVLSGNNQRNLNL